MMKSIASTAGATSELHLFDAPVGNDVLDREPSSERAVTRLDKSADKRPALLAKATDKVTEVVATIVRTAAAPRQRAPYVVPQIVSSAFDAAFLDPCRR